MANKEIRQHVSHAFGFHENECESSRWFRSDEIKEDGAFVVVLDVFDLLGDVLGRRTNTTYRKENVIFKEIPGKDLDITRKGGAKHKRLTFRGGWHVFALDNTTNLGFKTHIEHAISLIKYEIFDVGKANATAFDKVYKTTRSGTEEIAATLDLTELLMNVGSTVHNGGADP
jgi:hypothetical protein